MEAVSEQELLVERVAALAKVAERGMSRPSLVHPKSIRQLRDLTRYRRSLTQDRTREMQRPS